MKLHAQSPGLRERWAYLTLPSKSGACCAGKALGLHRGGITMSCLLCVCWAGRLVILSSLLHGIRCPGPCSLCLLSSGFRFRVVTRCGVGFTRYVSGDNLWELVPLLPCGALIVLRS